MRLPPSTDYSHSKAVNNSRISNIHGLLAISPVIVFLLLYVAVSLWLDDFYSMPICVALLAASAWSIIIYRSVPLVERIETFTAAAGHINIIYMLWIFILAGAFAALAREIGAVEATVDAVVHIMPPRWIVPGLFVAACFISFSVGTSVGTVVALAPLAVELAGVSGTDLGFLTAVVLGGAFFGDNLSFISDTTIAATRSQGCDMADKFKANCRIVIPAALTALLIYSLTSSDIVINTTDTHKPAWLMIPYLVVIVAALLRINVTIVLTTGIVAAIIAGCIEGTGMLQMMKFMGNGIDSMGDLIIITLLSAGMLGVIRAAGGIDWILQSLSKRITGAAGAQGVIGVLVGLVNLCTANNTVAIITVGSISHRIAQKFGIPPRKSASILDTCSCIVQCLIPYGAQTLLATSLAGIAPSAPFPYLYYPWALAVFVILSIVIPDRRAGRQALS